MGGTAGLGGAAGYAGLSRMNSNLDASGRQHAELVKQRTAGTSPVTLTLTPHGLLPSLGGGVIGGAAGAGAGASVGAMIQALRRGMQPDGTPEKDKPSISTGAGWGAGIGGAAGALTGSSLLDELKAYTQREMHV